MLELPTFPDTLPPTVHVGGFSPALTLLGQRMAAMNAFDAADLRTGQAGAARMIERAWQRWYAEDGSPVTRALPVNFTITDPSGIDRFARLARLGPGVPWLVCENYAAPARWYLGIGGDVPALGPAIAALYRGLSALCYAPTPPAYLAWAEMLWWGEGAGQSGRRPRHGPGSAPQGFPRLATFERRYPRCTTQPTNTYEHLLTINRRWPRLAKAIAALNAARRSRHLLYPNAHEIIPGGAPGTFGCFVRAHSRGDYTFRLLHDYEAHIERHKVPWLPFHGAWPLACEDDIKRARRGIAANARLARACADLLAAMGGRVSTNTMRAY